MVLKRFVLFTVAIAALLPVGGCAALAYISTAGQSASEVIESSAEELLIRLSTDKSVYRPGEAIVLNVTVINTTDDPIELHYLHASTGPPVFVRGSVTFWFGPQNDEIRRMQRFPVVSKIEEARMRATGGERSALGPGESQSRRFLLTQLSPQPGLYLAQVHLDAFWQISTERIGKLFSNLVQYRVSGDRLFERDNTGLLQKEEALKIAATSQPGDPVDRSARLIEDEMGFYKWWVALGYARPDGSRDQVVYLVDPYDGRIWGKVRPDQPSEANPERPFFSESEALRRFPPRNR